MDWEEWGTPSGIAVLSRGRCRAHLYYRDDDPYMEPMWFAWYDCDGYPMGDSSWQRHPRMPRSSSPKGRRKAVRTVVRYLTKLERWYSKKNPLGEGEPLSCLYSARRRRSGTE